MSYSQARLWAAVAGVSIWTLLAGAVIVILNDSRFGAQLDSLPDWGWLLILALGSQLLTLPADWLVGKKFPARYQQYRMEVDKWWGKWFRAAGVQAAIFLVLGFWLMLLGQTLGNIGSIGGMSLAMLLLAGLRIYVAKAMVKWESFFDNHKGKLVTYLDNQDPGFTGGISGIPGMEIFVLPNQWRKDMPEKMLTVMKGRRHGAIQTLSHAKGFLAAFLWNLLAFSIAVYLVPAGTTTGASTVMTILLYSLLTFLPGQLILSIISRKAVFEVDRWIYYRGGDADMLRKSFQQTVVKEEVPEEGGRYRQIINPVPGPQARAQYMAAQTAITGAWHAAQMALFLSWAGLNVFSRMRPSMLGRPERWVFAPGD